MEETIEIPLLNSHEVIAVSPYQLPGCKDIEYILCNERCQLDIWVNVALAYYKTGRMDEFVDLLEAAVAVSNIEYPNVQKDQMRCYDMLAAYQLQLAQREAKKDRRRELFALATHFFTKADKIVMYDSHHLLGRAYYCLLEGDKMEQADTQLDCVLNHDATNIEALMMKGCISFSRRDYQKALAFYKKALRANPNSPANLRLGMAHCFLKLGKWYMAQLAFERALELDPNCVGALVGLAIQKLNSGETSSNKTAIQMLSKAYIVDGTNASVLNHLANHFFYKKDYQKAVHLALHAFHNTELESMRAESCYHLARSFHMKGQYLEAFQYYYQATQLAPANFVLAHYGLGQMFIYRGDMENAVKCFDRVLKVVPNNFETLKVLGSLYATFKTQKKRDLAEVYLKKVIKLHDEDVEAWIEYAQLLESSDLDACLEAYDKAVQLLLAKKAPIPPELLNNIAALHYRFDQIPSAKQKIEQAIASVQSFKNQDRTYYEGLSVTLRYNLARLNEETFCFEKAEKLYKDIIREHPNYIDCFLRLGCMARDKGLICLAADYFKDALKIKHDSPDARALLGNLHMAKQQNTLGMKNFEAILKNPATAEDPYALLALGNFSLQALHQAPRDKTKDPKHQNRALGFYQQVLRKDASNIWAANGIGAVLGHKGFVNESQDVFAQVREITASFSDVWLNIAHNYVEQNQYMSAIQLYQNCMKRFYPHHNVEILLYLARALLCANKLREAKKVLLKARHVAPHDTVILFNIAIVTKIIASETLRHEHATLAMVQEAVDQLELALRYFRYLAIFGEKQRFNIVVAATEGKNCADILSQAQYQLVRARRIDEEEQLVRRKLEEQLLAYKRQQDEELLRQEQMAKALRESSFAKRQEFVEKNKGMLSHIGKPLKHKPATKKKCTFVDVYASDANSESELAAEVKGKKTTKKTKKPTKPSAATAPKKRKLDATESNAKSTVRKNMKIVSKEFISSSDSDSSDTSPVSKTKAVGKQKQVRKRLKHDISCSIMPEKGPCLSDESSSESSEYSESSSKSSN